MVFHGGFSKGCQTCRNRRVKCDEGKPVCTRCIKSKRRCLGYRDEADLLFRDETQTVVIRAQQNYPPSASHLVEPLAPNTTLYTLTSGNLRDFNYWNAPTESIEVVEQRAVKKFFSMLFLSLQQSPISGRFLECLPVMYNHADHDSPLYSATIALALGACCNNAKGRHLLPRVGVRYGEALKRANTAIGHPSEHCNNDTLMTILLFGLIESINAGPESMPYWDTHNKGASSLVRLRGRAMLKDDTSIKILLAVRTQMLNQHIYRSEPLSDFFDENDHTKPSWNELPAAIASDPAQTLTHVAISIPNLRALADGIFHQPIDDCLLGQALELVGQCKAIDSKLIDWFNTTPQEWAWMVVRGHLVVPSGIDGYLFESCPNLNQYHVYKDVWLSNLFNDYRILRIYVNAIILRCGAWLMGCSLAELDLQDKTRNMIHLSDCVQAKNATLALMDDICCSIPYHLGAIQTHITPSQHGSPAGLSPPPLGPFFTVRALRVAMSMTIAPVSQRRWAQEVLMIVGKRFGVNIATVLASAKATNKLPMFDPSEQCTV